MTLMSNQVKIGNHEILALLIALMSAKVFLSLPRNMALLGDSAGWMIGLFSGFFSLVGFYFIAALLKKYPGKNLFEIAEIITGQIIGKVFGVIFFLFFLTTTSLFLRQFTESFIIAILPRTPISVLSLFFLILLIYATLLGIEAISRVAWFFGPYLLGFFIITIIFSFPTNPQLLLPIFGKGPLVILKQAALHLNFFSDIILLAFVAPLLEKQKDVFRIGAISLIISTLINALTTAAVIMTFNYVATQRLFFPIYQLTRLISIGEFFQRVEAVFVFLWFFTAAIQMSGLFYGTIVSFSQTFKIRNQRPLVFPLAVLIFALSLVPASMAETIYLDEYILSNFYAGITFGIPILLLLISFFVKPKKEASNAK